ncbi:MAG: type II secretion system protein [Phycisphaerae bacterium]
MKTRKAFTLVELLVVISIIALLVGVLLPALSRAREQGRMIVCRTNEKSLVLGASLWSNDHDGWAIAGDWFKDKEPNKPGEDCAGDSSLGPYIGAERGRKGSVKVCPTAVHSSFFSTDPHFRSSSIKYTYAENGYLTYNLYDEVNVRSRSPGTQGMDTRIMGSGKWKGPSQVHWLERGMNKMVDIRMPAQTVYFIDHEYYFACDWQFNPTKTIAELTVNHPEYKFKTRWHFKKPKSDYGVGNIGWVDGHASVEPKDLADYNPSGASLEQKERWRYYFYDH